MSRNILDIYNSYKIMSLNLQPHMLRVAAVSKIVSDACNEVGKAVDTESVVAASLLHDMGNIIKFDLTFFPEFTKDKGLEYWQQVKNEFMTKYGNNEHIATDTIVKELNVSNKIVSLLSLTGFSKAIKVLNEGTLEMKICNYADMRVGPYGILSIKERCEDGKIRHARKTNETKNLDTDFSKVVEALYKIEQDIFSSLKIKPEDITNEKVESVVEELKKWEI